MNESTLKKLPDPALLDFGVDHSGTGYRLEKNGRYCSGSATAIDNGQATEPRALEESSWHIQRISARPW
jgi:hypothetical protein